jgi:hypothetical protein
MIPTSEWVIQIVMKPHAVDVHGELTHLRP